MTDKKPRNPDAFPRPFSADENSPHDYDAQDGMTLRDYFAAKAMQALLTTSGSSFGDLPSLSISLPRFSYIMADAMLKAREESK